MNDWGKIQVINENRRMSSELSHSIGEVEKLRDENAKLRKKLKELEAEMDKYRCPICHRIACTSDHGYGAGGGDWG